MRVRGARRAWSAHVACPAVQTRAPQLILCPCMGQPAPPQSVLLWLAAYRRPTAMLGCVHASSIEAVAWQIMGSSWTPSCASGASTGCPAWPCMASCALPPATCAASWLSGARRPCGGHVPIWRCPRPMGSASWRKARRDQLWGQGPSVVSQQGLAWPAPRRLAGALGARATRGRLSPSLPSPNLLCLLHLLPSSLSPNPLFPPSLPPPLPCVPLRLVKPAGEKPVS